MNRTTRNFRSRAGTVLIVTMLVTFALAGSVLVLCRSMRVETMASANLAASLQASSIERGAEQYILGMLSQEGEGVRDLAEDQFAAVPVGDGYFWVLRPDYDDDSLPAFGLVEESAKVNVNSASFDQLMRLPGMTFTAGSCIKDWIDDNETLERDGAESEYYLSLHDTSEPYYCKNSRLETVEELLLVRGVDREMLYGTGAAQPLGERSNIAAAGTGFTDPQLARGIYDLVTVYSRENNTSADGNARININRSSSMTQLRTRLQQKISSQRADEIMNAIGAAGGRNPGNFRDVFDFYFRGKVRPDEFDLIADDLTTDSNRSIRGRININTAPRAVLACLDGLATEDVDKLLAQRDGAVANDSTSLSWIIDALGQKAIGLGSQITTRTLQFSADILAVSGNGRSFKRCRIVVDTRRDTPRIVYRRELTEKGWPMDKQLLASLRNGQGPGSWPVGVASAAGAMR